MRNDRRLEAAPLIHTKNIMLNALEDFCYLVGCSLHFVHPLYFTFYISMYVGGQMKLSFIWLQLFNVSISIAVVSSQY